MLQAAAEKEGSNWRKLECPSQHPARAQIRRNQNAPVSICQGQKEPKPECTSQLLKKKEAIGEN
jgi:hypothetical protein